MPRLSAGILLYRRAQGRIELLLVHPGGPFWAKKDSGAWSIPKGEYGVNEDALVAAHREFREETGFEVPEGRVLALGDVAYSGKVVKAWAVEGDVDARKVSSNTFTMEWPPKSGQQQQFAEVDRAGWFPPFEARQKLVKGQVALVDRLCELLGIATNEESDSSSDQLSLL